MADFFNTLAFLIFPYAAITIFIVGHAYRYVTDWKNWNAKSSEFLDKDNLDYGITIFHWGVIIVFFGHAGGMLIPQSVFDIFGFNYHRHELVAFWMGLFAGILMVVGVAWLLIRRVNIERIAAITSKNDFALLVILLLIASIGLYNLLFTRYDTINKIAPWIQSIVILNPKPELMQAAPPSFKLHILLAFALFAWSPWTRLVHIWSLPVSYVYRGYVVFRRRV